MAYYRPVISSRRSLWATGSANVKNTPGRAFSSSRTAPHVPARRSGALGRRIYGREPEVQRGSLPFGGLDLARKREISAQSLRKSNRLPPRPSGGHRPPRTPAARAEPGRAASLAEEGLPPKWTPTTTATTN